ncbi:MAG: hypothetical protein AAGM67_19280, partial [Bacteroidota bacterium]
ALKQVSSGFDCSRFFLMNGDFLNLRLWQNLFSSETDRYFSLQAKKSKLQRFFSAPKDVHYDTPVKAQILFASDLPFMESADQVMIFELLCVYEALFANNFDGEMECSLKFVLAKVEVFCSGGNLLATGESAWNRYVKART